MRETKTVTFAQAIGEAIDEEMEKDENIIIIGEDIGPYGGVYKHLTGLWEKYGDMRVRDTPISEAATVGMAVGMAMTGMRPIVDLMHADFLFMAMDQLANQAAKIRYMTGGQIRMPFTLIAPIGGGRSKAAQHSQSPQSIIAHIPGLMVALPSDAAEAKGLLKSAIRNDNPVVFFEHKVEFNRKMEIPVGDYTIPFGEANIVRQGSDVTIVATSTMVTESKKAAKELAQAGIDVEVIDLRTLVPLDRVTIIRSVKKTGRLLIVDEGHQSFGAGAEIGMSVMQDVFYDLDMPIMRLGAVDVPIPFSPPMEEFVIPNAEKIYRIASEMAHHKGF